MAQERGEQRVLAKEFYKAAALAGFDNDCKERKEHTLLACYEIVTSTDSQGLEYPEKPYGTQLDLLFASC